MGELGLLIPQIGNRKFYDLIDIEVWETDPFYTAFFEWRSPNNTTVRLEANRLGNWEFCRQRFRYDGGIRGRLSGGIGKATAITVDMILLYV